MSTREEFTKSALTTKVENYSSTDDFEAGIEAMRKLGWQLYSWKMIPVSTTGYFIVAVYGWPE